MAIPPIPSSVPIYREAIESEAQAVPNKPAVPVNSNPTVMVNGKPVSSKDEASGKCSEHKLIGQVQEAKVRSIYESTKDQQTVFVNNKETHRQGDRAEDCGKDIIEEKN